MKVKLVGSRPQKPALCDGGIGEEDGDGEEGGHNGAAGGYRGDCRSPLSGTLIEQRLISCLLHYNCSDIIIIRSLIPDYPMAYHAVLAETNQLYSSHSSCPVERCPLHIPHTSPLCLIQILHSLVFLLFSIMILPTRSTTYESQPLPRSNLMCPCADPTRAANPTSNQTERSRTFWSPPSAPYHRARSGGVA